MAQQVRTEGAPRVARQTPSRQEWFILAVALVLVVAAATLLFVGSATTTTESGGASTRLVEQRTEQLWENKQAAAQGYLRAKLQPSGTGDQPGSFAKTPQFDELTIKAARAEAAAHQMGS